MANVGLFVPLISQTGKANDITNFLNAGYGLLPQEPLTLQWFAVKYSDVTPDTFAIFDTFSGEEGRNGHLTGPIAKALMENASNLLSEGPEINKVEILASKVDKATSTDSKAGLSVGLRVLITAKEDKVDAVRKFLTGAVPLVNDEPLTSVWYAIHFPGTNKFGIVDFFSSEEGRAAHLTGAVAKALFASVEELLAGPPDVVKVDVVAAKVKA